LGKRGQVIIVGRGANFLFKDALKIRIIADYEDRISSLRKYEKFSRKEAEAIIKKSDANRKKFVQNLFGENLEDAKHYDLVIKTGPQLSIDDAVSGIAKLAKKRFRL
jgi:cytidylate kinase